MDGLMAQNLVSDRQDALGLEQGFWLAGKANHPVVALAHHIGRS